MAGTLVLEEYQDHLNVPRGHPSYRLLRFYGGVMTEYSVIITGGVASTFPGIRNPTTTQVKGADIGGSGENGRSAFIGGHLYEDDLTDAEETILEDAGYTVEGGGGGGSG